MERAWGRSAVQPLTLQLGILASLIAIAFANPTLALFGGALFAAAWSRRSSGALVERERTGWLLAVVVPVAVLVLSVAAVRPIASDDLLRDIAVGRYGFSYQAMYPLSAASLPQFSLWWGFDHALNHLAAIIGPLPTVWAIQGFGGLAMVLVLALAGRQILPATPERPFWVGIGVLAVTALVLNRALLARPEFLLSVWAVSAVLATTRAGTLLWFLAGLAASAAYWLMPLYLPAVVLIKASWKARIVLAAFLCTVHVAVWHVVSGGAYFEVLSWLPEVLKGQVAAVSENAPLAGYVLLWPFAFLLAGGAMAAVRSPGAVAPMLLAGYFAASDQARYVSVVAPLLCIATWHGVAGWKPAPPRSLLLALCLALPLFALQLAQRAPRLEDSPRFDLPTASLTLTAFGHAAYSVPFFASGQPRVEPSYALGAAPREVQNLSFELLQGRIDCAAVRRWPFTHVLERTLTATPPCLALVGVQGAWRLWEIRSDP